MERQKRDDFLKTTKPGERGGGCCDRVYLYNLIVLGIDRIVAAIVVQLNYKGYYYFPILWFALEHVLTHPYDENSSSLPVPMWAQQEIPAM